MTEHSVGSIVKIQTLVRAAKVRKLWTVMFVQVPPDLTFMARTSYRNLYSSLPPTFPLHSVGWKFHLNSFSAPVSLLSLTEKKKTNKNIVKVSMLYHYF